VLDLIIEVALSYNPIVGSNAYNNMIPAVISLINLFLLAGEVLSRLNNTNKKLSVVYFTLNGLSAILAICALVCFSIV
jgi:hypothetical protein